MNDEGGGISEWRGKECKTRVRCLWTAFGEQLEPEHTFGGTFRLFWDSEKKLRGGELGYFYPNTRSSVTCLASPQIIHEPTFEIRTFSEKNPDFFELKS